MKCVKCGYESPSAFSVCPACGTVQTVTGSAYTVPHRTNASSGRTGGEKAAIIIAIAASILSIIAAFIIFFAYTYITTSNAIDEYGIDSFDDFDSNEYDDDLEEFFKEYYNSDDNYTSDSPAGLNTPIQFKETLYSFSAGEVDTEYEVSMLESYRGEAAVKLLEGATLPDLYDEDDIYLIKIKIKITDQGEEAIVTLPKGYPVAYPSKTVSAFSAEYEYLEDIPYANKLNLVTKGDEVITWMAFVVNKDDESPCIRWNLTEDKVFRNMNSAVSDATAVESGAAIDLEEPTESDSVSSEEFSSND